MAYTSPADVRQILRKLPTSITDEDIQYHVDRAEALIDGILGGVYVTPFQDPIPRLINVISTDLAVYSLAHSLYTSNMPNLDETYRDRYEQAMKLLDEIAKGAIDIGVEKKSESGFAITNDEQIFNYEEPWW